MRAIIYSRVSTDRQEARGHSLPEQKHILESYCRSNGIRIVKHYTEDYSAKNFDRPSWNELTAFVKANRRELDLVLVSEWDRLGRNQRETLNVIESFKAMGVEINSVTQPLRSDYDDPDSIVMRALNTALPEAENARRRNKVIGGTRRALKSGYFVYRVPLGYRRCKIGNKVAIEPDPETAPIIQWIFEKYSVGLTSQDELRSEVRRRFNIKISKTNMMHLLKRETYLGKIKIKAYKNEPEEIVDGLHDAIINVSLYNKVQEVIYGKAPARKFPKTANEDFPLRGHLVCDSCGSKLTASSSKGRNKYYSYYHCQKPCRERHKTEDVHEAIEALLREISIPVEHIALFKALLQEQIESNARNARTMVQKYTKEITEIEEKIDRAEELVFDGKLPADLFNRQSEKYEQRLRFLKSELAHMEDHTEDLSNYIEACADLLTRLDYWYAKADIDIKRKLLGSIFPENLIFDGSSYRTSETSELIQALRAGMPFFNAQKGMKKGTPGGSALLSWSTRART